MKLALRFLLFALLGILLVVAGSTWLNFRREIALFDVDLERDHRVLAHALAPAFLMTWEHDGQAAALRLLSRANLTEGLLQSRWVPAGDSGAPSAELPPTQDGLLHVVQHPSSNVSEMVTFAPVKGPAGAGFIEIRESLEPRQ